MKTALFFFFKKRKARACGFFMLLLCLLSPQARAQSRQASPSTMNATKLDSTHERLDAFFKALTDTLHAELGIAFRDLTFGHEYFFNPNLTMHAASTMKVPVMIEVFRQAERGKLHLADSVLVKNKFASIVDGSPYSLDLAEDSDEAIYNA
ncbi:MAG: serine hydrolase, partial [candidate division KSB1 bacterium]